MFKSEVPKAMSDGWTELANRQYHLRLLPGFPSSFPLLLFPWEFRKPYTVCVACSAGFQNAWAMGVIYCGVGAGMRGNAVRIATTANLPLVAIFLF